MSRNKVNDQEAIFNYLVHEILCFVKAEQYSNYSIMESEQNGEISPEFEHDIQDLLSAHKLEISDVESIENLPRILEFIKDLIKLFEEKYCKYPEGYYYYKDAVKKMREFIPILEDYQTQK